MAIVKAENIELDEGELDEMYQKMADEYKMEVDQIKQYVDEKIIVLDMKRRKGCPAHPRHRGGQGARGEGRAR